MDEDEDEDEVEAKHAALSKSQKKKLNKKLKVDSGEAVPAGAPSTKKEVKEKEKEKAPESSPESSKKENKEKKKEHNKEKKEKKKDEKKGKKPEETNGAPTASTSADATSNKKTLAGGLVIEDSKVGSGKTAKAGSHCAMRYIGKLSNGTVFDSNTKGQAVSGQKDVKKDENAVFTYFAVQFYTRPQRSHQRLGSVRLTSRYIVPSDSPIDSNSGVLPACERAVSE